MYVVCMLYVSSLDSKPAVWNSLVPEKTLLLTLGPKKVRKDFAEKLMTGVRRGPVNLEPRVLKIPVFGARRRLLHPHPHFGLGSNANVFYFFICCGTSEAEMRVKEFSASSKNNNF